MEINNSKNTPAFSANLIMSGKKLKDAEITQIRRIIDKVGEKDDIVEINVQSDILDWIEINQQNHPTKFLSGFKLFIESTIEKFEKTDLSTALTQQRFWEGFSEFSPLGVIEKWAEAVLNNEPIDTKRINTRPEIYNAENDNWEHNCKIEIEEKPRKAPVKTFYNSPFYKAMMEHREIGLKDIFEENLANGTHRINLDQLRSDIAELKKGNDVRTPITDFATGRVHPKAEEVKSSKYIFIEGLQTQFPEIEELADLIMRVEVPADNRKTSFIDRAAQGGVKKEQAEKDLDASNEYMEKLIPLNPNSADMIINGRYNKDDLIAFLKMIFG